MTPTMMYMFVFVRASSVPLTLESAPVTKPVAEFAVEVLGLTIVTVTCSTSGVNALLKIALLPFAPFASFAPLAPLAPLAPVVPLPPLPLVLTVGVMVIGLPYPVALRTGAPKI